MEKSVYAIVQHKNLQRSSSYYTVTYDPQNARGCLCTKDKPFWDIVGDAILSQAWSGLNEGEFSSLRILYRLQDCSENEGMFYTKQVVQELAEKSHCCLIPINNNPGHLCNCQNQIDNQILCEGGTTQMQTQCRLPTLKEYQAQRHSKGAFFRQEVSAADDLKIAPFTSSRVSANTVVCRDALRFAHPVDQSVVSLLDNPSVNAVFNKFVQTLIDAQYGMTLAKGIHITPSTFSELHNIVSECAQRLGIPTPYVIISDEVQGVNAFTVGTNQFSFIAVSNLLPLVMSLDELKFVIGHECGHLLFGHVVYHTAASVICSAGGYVPLIGPTLEKTIRLPLRAWNRASEISADRAGLICCGDILTAKRALFKLEAGLMNADDVDIDGYVQDAEDILSNVRIGKYAEVFYTHPIIPKRIKALTLFSESRQYAAITGQSNGSRLFSDEELKAGTDRIIGIFN